MLVVFDSLLGGQIFIETSRVIIEEGFSFDTMLIQMSILLVNS